MAVQIRYRKSQFLILSAAEIDRGSSNFNIQTTNVTNANAKLGKGSRVRAAPLEIDFSLPNIRAMIKTELDWPGIEESRA